MKMWIDKDPTHSSLTSISKSRFLITIIISRLAWKENLVGHRCMYCHDICKGVISGQVERRMHDRNTKYGGHQDI